ncbi:MAG: PhoU domain-containing protein [Thermoplasmatota archaeon]
MDIRKVQLTGGSSYVITLPKEWVKSLNIKKNDPVGLIAQPDGTLLVTKRTSEGRVHRTKEIRVDNLDDGTFLFRILIGAYIMGYSTITLRSSSRLRPLIRDTVMSFVQNTIGPEIMDESSSHITIRDLLSPTEMPFDMTIKRMHVLVRTMHEDAMTAFQRRDRQLAELVFKRDGDVNRLHWLIARQANMILTDVTLSKKMGLTLEEANSYFLISRIVERIGDHAVRIAKNVQTLMSRKLEGGLQEELLKASALSLSILTSSIETWFKRDIRAAHTNLERVPTLLAVCEGINSVVQNMRGASSVPITDISDSIRRTGEYAADISELVINNLITDLS